MPGLMHLSVRDLLHSFSSASPTPGGGSAVALAGALGTSLLMMVAAMPRTRTGRDEDRRALDAVRRELDHTRDRLAALVDDDREAYDAVMAAYRLPKGTDPERQARAGAIQTALRGATEVPLDVMRACHAAAREGLTVARLGNPAAASDVSVAFELLRAALRGAADNARINLADIGDPGFVTGAEDAVAGQERAMEEAVAEARQALATTG